MTEKQCHQREFEASNSWHTYWTSTRGGGRSEASFLSMDFLGDCLQKFHFFFFFEILLYFLFIYIATHIFVLPRHAVPYIVNTDRNFVLYCFVGVYHCANFGTTTTKLWHKIGSRVEISEPQ